MLLSEFDSANGKPPKVMYSCSFPECNERTDQPKAALEHMLKKHAQEEMQMVCMRLVVIATGAFKYKPASFYNPSFKGKTFDFACKPFDVKPAQAPHRDIGTNQHKDKMVHERLWQEHDGRVKAEAENKVYEARIGFMEEIRKSEKEIRKSENIATQETFKRKLVEADLAAEKRVCKVEREKGELALKYGSRGSGGPQVPLSHDDLVNLKVMLNQ